MYYADADVKHVDHFERGEALEWPGKDTHIGGGGTDFRPALAAIESDETPVCVVCITDLYGRFPAEAPGLPVIWLSTTENKQAPFGETVYVDE
jgi:predicted metal-dependent peptidase